MAGSLSRFEIYFQGGLVANTESLDEVTSFIEQWLQEVEPVPVSVVRKLKQQVTIHMFVALDDGADCLPIGEYSLSSLYNDESISV
jgi:hypothetical protein